MTPEMQKRFWAKVDKSGECWEWTACLNEKGYGMFGIGTKRLDRAHRISYRMLVEEIPKGLFVCHRCDNPKCVNPSHLFLGTNRENVEDMHAKGRNSPPPPMGGWNKFDWAPEVVARFGVESDAAIGRSIGVSKHAVQRERKRRGIPSVPSQTQFRTGTPHPRWGQKEEVKNGSTRDY